jgi:hypothetical protein
MEIQEFLSKTGVPRYSVGVPCIVGGDPGKDILKHILAKP